MPSATFLNTILAAKACRALKFEANQAVVADQRQETSLEYLRESKEEYKHF